MPRAQFFLWFGGVMWGVVVGLTLADPTSASVVLLLAASLVQLGVTRGVLWDRKPRPTEPVQFILEVR